MWVVSVKDGQQVDFSDGIHIRILEVENATLTNKLSLHLVV